MVAGKILLVEDNEDEEALALFAFEKTGISKESVTVVRDGQEAVDYLYCQGQYESRDKKDKPKVVFLDLNLPKLHGLEVLKRLRSNESTAMLPVVILTSSDEHSDICEGYRSGANSYILKSFDLKEFTASIKALGNYWLDLNMLPDDQLG